jgi:hypothetical protein
MQEVASIGDLVRSEAAAAAAAEALVRQASGKVFSPEAFQGFDFPKAGSGSAAALQEAAGQLLSQASAERRAAAASQGADCLPFGETRADPARLC